MCCPCLARSGVKSPPLLFDQTPGNSETKPSTFLGVTSFPFDLPELFEDHGLILGRMPMPVSMTETQTETSAR